MSQTTIMPGGKYVDEPSIYVTRHGQVVAGCSTSYHGGSRLSAGSIGTPAAVQKARDTPGEKADIDKKIIRSIYLETIDDLDPAVWDRIKENDKYAQATFAEEFKYSVQRYLDTGVQPAAARESTRATDFDLLTGSKAMPHSAASGLHPVWTAGGASSERPQADIVMKDDTTHLPVPVRDVAVNMPFTIQTLGTTGDMRSLLSRNYDPAADTQVAKFTGTKRWWEDDVVGGAVFLEPSFNFELQKLGQTHDDATVGEVKESIEDMCGAYVERQIKFGTVISRDLTLQQPNHKSLSGKSRWRVQDIPGKPTVTLTMRPMQGQVESEQERVMIQGRVLR